MANRDQLRARLAELNEREWDPVPIEARFKKLFKNGGPPNPIPREELITRKEEVLDRIQRHGEEYANMIHSCAKGCATALFEAFGLGNMEMVRGLTPFPGLAMTKNICGPITGALVALSLYFSHPDVLIYEPEKAYAASRKFLARYEETFGSLMCPDIQKLILGTYIDPFESPEAREAFKEIGAGRKCPLAPGIGARIAAEIIIDSIIEEEEK